LKHCATLSCWVIEEEKYKNIKEFEIYDS